jgi:hypothetical protein
MKILPLSWTCFVMITTTTTTHHYSKLKLLHLKRRKKHWLLCWITFVARRRMGIEWEAMVVRQKAPSVSPPMVRAVLGDSRLLI